MNRLKRLFPSLLLLSTAALFYLPLGSHALWDSDEGRYAEIAREMIELKDWIAPHLNYVLYFEKPPLVYWLTALSMKLMGPTEFAARFWCATFGFLTVLLTRVIGRRWKNERVGWMAGGMLACSLLFFGLTQFLVLDMALTFWMMLALYAGTRLLFERSSDHVGLYSVMFAVAAAGGFLTKGPVAVLLPVLALAGIAWKYQLFSRLQRFSLGPALAAAAVLVLPWFILVSWRHPVFPQFFFIREHVQRYLTDVHHRTEPFYFFIPVLLGGFFPWSFFLPRVIRSWFGRERMAMERDPQGALWIGWVLGVVLFFSLSQSKLVAYIVPVIPALALLVAHEWDQFQDQAVLPLSVKAGLGGVVLTWVALLFVIQYPPERLQTPEWAMIVPALGWLRLGIVLVISITVGAFCMRPAAPAFFGLLAGQFLFLAALVPVAQALDPLLSAKSLAAVLEERIRPGEQVATYGISYENKMQSFVFYTGRRLMVLGDPGELTLGRDQDLQSGPWFAEESQMDQAVTQLPAGTWIFTDANRAQRLLALPDTYQFIDKQGPRVLFQKLR